MKVIEKFEISKQSIEKLFATFPNDENVILNIYDVELNIVNKLISFLETTISHPKFHKYGHDKNGITSYFISGSHYCFHEIIEALKNAGCEEFEFIYTAAPLEIKEGKVPISMRDNISKKTIYFNIPEKIVQVYE